ncbi:redoxin domain-containing protein [Mucilaginibacter sp.]
MKKTCLLLALPAFMAAQSAMAQTYAHLKLSTEHPAAGKPITFTYNTAGTNLAGKPDVQGMVYYIDGKNFPASDLIFKREAGVYKATTVVPVTAKAFFVKLSADEEIDNNDGAGYLYKIYSNGKPVPGADASEALILTNGLGTVYAKIKRNPIKAYDLYNAEFKAHPQSYKEFQADYITLLVNSKNQQLKTTGEGKLPMLINSNNENDVLTASSLLRSLNHKAKADSLDQVIIQRFPVGIKKKITLIAAFNKEQDLAKKEVLYSDFLKAYPENVDNWEFSYDNMRLQMMQAYIKAGNKQQFDYYAARMTNKSYLAGNLNSIAWDMAKKGERLDEAAQISKQSLDIEQQLIAHPKASAYTSLGEVKKGAQEGYGSFADTYAYILAKQGKYADALKYEQPVYEHRKGLDPDINENYAMMLIGAGDHAKAQKVIEGSLKAGKSSPALEEQLKTTYLKVKGNDKGYDSYLASLKSTMQDKQRADLMKEMVNQPAPQFALKDFSGNTVSLASLKGKVVVVDFWATWCGPCKASFPGMQMAVNKYKDNPDVKFVFIDTWENGDNYQDGVKKFIADNNYTFHVLMDEKGEDSRQSKVVSQFKVDGIPTKFIIDQNGNIRFKHVGFSGTAESVMGEVSAMIDLLQKPQGMATAKAEE